MVLGSVMMGKTDIVKCAHKLWEDLKTCRNDSTKFVLGDMNAKVGSVETGDVDEEQGVDGVNEDGHYFVDVCVEEGLFPVKHLKFNTSYSTCILGQKGLK